jgi:hypothetical protein
MFREKDRRQKSLKLIKKENNNKDTRDKQLCKESHGFLWNGEQKALQQYLNDEFDIKVHKNVLRSGQISMNNVVNSEFDQSDDESKVVGNTTVDKLEHVICQINMTDIPADWSQKHDKTRWNTNKTKTKIRNKSRDNKVVD